MRCARCHRLVVRGLRTCAGCGAELPGAIGVEASRLERPTERGPTGPLQDFSLHREPMNMRRAPSPRTGGGQTRTPKRVLQAPEQGGTEASPSQLAGTARSTLEPTFAFEATKTALSGSPDRTTGTSHFTQLLRRRLVAGVIDVGILIGINVAVVYFTLRLAGLPVASVGQLPAVPLLAFLWLFDFGYLAVLTAFGGQTIGKMATGLRVETGRGSPVTLGGALKRTAAYGVSILPAGLGLLGVFLRWKRPLHDLLADTLVVKA